jgi:hypothetical protein
MSFVASFRAAPSSHCWQPHFDLWCCRLPHFDKFTCKQPLLMLWYGDMCIPPDDVTMLSCMWVMGSLITEVVERCKTCLIALDDTPDLHQYVP